MEAGENPIEDVIIQWNTENDLIHLYEGKCICEKPSQKCLNLLVLGSTGAGKTTLVDSYFNQLLGIGYYDKFRYKLVDETE